MTGSDEHLDETLDPKAPKALRKDLVDLYLYKTAPAVPSAVDRAILGMARRRFARRRWLVTLGWAGPIAAAAAIVLAVLIADPFTGQDRSPATPAEVTAREDIDRNGRIDILDAFALARKLEAGSERKEEEEKEEWDFNNDGKVDASDVDWVALAAVSLDKGALP